MAINECTKEIKSIKHCANYIRIAEANDWTTIYNNNKACVQWSDSVTSKGIKHPNLIENMVLECHKPKDVNVEHIPVIINPSDIFTKEMEYNTHIRNIRDSMMV